MLLKSNLITYGLIVILLVSLCSCDSRRGSRKGLWVECEGSNCTLDSLDTMEEMLTKAKEHGFTDIYAQVYRRNRSWYRSELADDEPCRLFTAAHEVDPLAHLISRSHGSGMRLHAWLNVYCIGPGTEQTVINELGKEAIIKDDRQASMADYKRTKVIYPEGVFYLDSAMNWLDPANLEVQAYLLKVIEELLDRYPEVDGIHLDFIRYPYALPITPVSRIPTGLGFGYNEESIKRFQDETGLTPPAFDSQDRSGGNTWDQWRRDQVTTLVQKAHDLTRARRKTLSAAVIAWADRAYLSAFQDWRGWLETGTIDDVLVMNYTRDTPFARQITRQSVAARGKGKVLIGLGAYVLGRTPEDLARQIKDVQEAEADGYVLFSYDTMLESPQLFEVSP
ncbi:glycoside hydrolase family 10 protein [Acidobacteriota bacterium]